MKLMMYIQPTITILALLFAPLVSFPGEVETVSAGKIIAQNQCSWCHGSVGQGFSTAPQLATQNPSYIESQLRSFQAHLQTSPSSRQYMWGVAGKLNPQSSRALALYYSTLSAESSSDGIRGLRASGEALYREGDPASNIPSCVPCHGLAAEGIGAIPRLRGQSYSYLKMKLPRWKEGYDAATEPPMPAIAAKLSTSDIQALASYLSFVD